MKKLLALVVLSTALLSSLAQAADTIGVVTGTLGTVAANVAQVPASPAVQAFICTPTWKPDTCWPSYAGSSASALVSSLAPTQHVWASIGGAAPKWVPLSAVTIPASTGPVPVPPPVGQSARSVSWAAVTQNVDGSPLTDLKGWNVYVGTKSGQYAAPVLMPADTFTYDLSALTAGTYYAVIAAVSTSEGESAKSAELTVTIDPPPSPPVAQVLRCTSAAPTVAGMQATAVTTCTYGP